MSAELLARLDAFDLDGGPAALPFAARLAREHGWPRPFADRVVREYKRFAYLAATAGHPVTPSQAVDHCWHLHLCYTRSYWERFCRDVLLAPLHHTPTAGGPAERSRYHAQYERTLAAYRQAFGAPPPDIWPPAAVRFGDDLREVTVNTARHWVVPKAPVKRLLAAGVVVGLAVGGGAGCGGGLDPFALPGKEYLGFLAPALLLAVAAGLMLRASAKGSAPAGEPPPLDWQHAALLAGGPQRLLAAAVARLAHAGAVQVGDDGKRLLAVGPPPADATPAERAVLAALPVKQDAVDVLRLSKQVGEASAEVRLRLEDDGLVLSAEAARRAAWLSATPLLLALAGFGLTRLVTGLANNKPVGFLVITLVLGAVAAAVLVAARPYRTRAGDRAKRQLPGRVAAAGGASADPALAVAVLGTAALAGTGLEAVRAWYPRKAMDAGGSDAGGFDSGGGGDGGGCGGGCGGCGGGD